MVLRRALFSLVLAAASAPAQTASISVQPQLITHCNASGLAHADIVWSAPGTAAVQVRVNAPAGVPMTGFEPSTGRAATEDWVTDGLAFVLVGATGVELARTTAAVDCAAADNSGFLPLDVGNEWIYRHSSRNITSDYIVWRITRAERIEGNTWFVLSTSPSSTDETLYRVDSEGRTYRRTRSSGMLMPESLWLDPPGPRSNLTLFENPSTLIGRNISFTRGLGIVTQTENLIAGSSGGFFNGLQLVRARVGGLVVFDTAAGSLRLSVESLVLDVTGRRVTNCAVPCYFVACGLVPGADPPDTYKPCFQARVQLKDFPAASVDLTLTDSVGVPAYQATLPVDPPEGFSEWNAFHQVPLYSEPNVPLLSGSYRLRAVVKLPGGAEAAETSTVLEIH